jgi:colicin import membrane protein
MKLFLLLAFWLGLVGSSSAQVERDLGQQERNAERRLIAAEKQQIESAFNAAQAICWHKFFVNACLEDLRPARSAALADLRRREVEVNAVERKISAADQILKNQEGLALQRIKQAEQEIQLQQEAGELTRRAKQKEINLQNAAEQAARNKADQNAKQDTGKSKAIELEAKQAQAAANVETTRKRREQASRRRTEREQRLREDGPPTGKALPAYQ